MMLRRLSNAAAVACLLLPIACVFAQDEDTPPVIRRPSFGARVEYVQSRLFTTSSADASTTSPVADYHYSGSTPAHGLVFTPTAEYRLRPNLSIGLEFHFLHAQYKQRTEIRTGTTDPAFATDTRKVTTVTESTKASYYEVPVLLHYYGLRHKGLFGLWAKSYATGGFTYRHVGTIRSGTEYANADGSTDYNEIAVAADHTNQLGLVAGIGLRFVDAFRIKVAPEVRYTRWLSTTFHGEAFRSAANQLTAGLGFSF